MAAPSVTVIVCTHNRAHSLADAIAAIAAMTPPGLVEILVVDNGSTDSTAAVVAAAQVGSSFELRYLHEPKAGKSFALNSGINAARGDLIAFTDDDAAPRQDWLQTIVRTFSTTQCDWVYGRVVPRWPGNSPDWFAPSLNGLFALLDLGDRSFTATNGTPEFFGVNCAARRQALTALGPYREDLGPTNALGGGGEDTEMFHRALERGQRIVYEPTVVVEHLIPAERCTKAFHRRRMIDGRRKNYLLAVGASGFVPRVLGIPRYWLRQGLTDVRVVVVGWFSRSKAAFESELRLIRLAGVLEQALRERLRRGGNLTSPPAHRIRA